MANYGAADTNKAALLSELGAVVPREQRRLSAIMSADVVGYSRLMEGDESKTLQRLKTARSQIIDPAISEFSGRIVKTTGDGILCEFSSAVDAVQCAVEIQKNLGGKDEESHLQYRIGINLGDIIIEGGDIFGDGVNIAARIEALAEPGAICLSGSIYDQIVGKLSLEIEAIGEHQVKNIDRPVLIYSIGPQEAAGSISLNGTPDKKGSRPVIAVLPFENMSSGSEDEYFADGLTEDILTALSRFRELLVIARNSTFRYKGQAVDIPKVGRELNAGYVVEGSVRRAANRLRITAQLIQTSDGTHIWADHYDRELEDIFAVQDELTQKIAAALGVRLQDAAREIALRKKTDDLNAYDCVLRARRYTVTLSTEEHANARDLLEQAIALDPNYADAYAMLANVYLAEHRFDVNPRPNPVERAMAMVEKAIEFDPQNAYARCWSAIVHFFQHDNETFKAEGDRALSLNPNDPEILAEMGHYHSFLGEFEKGEELTKRAIELNPLHPSWYFFCFARKHLYEGKYLEAIADVKKINMPNFYWSWIIMAAAFGHLGETDKAAEALSRIGELMPHFSVKAHLRKWNTSTDDLEKIYEGLKKAGLQQ